MANQPLFSAATNREPNQENTGGITPARMSIREIVQQRLSQCGRYIRSAYNIEEDDRLRFDERTSQEK
jgi:hypothetical protein